MGLIGELKRRNVIRMAGLYLVGAWLVVQVAGTLLPVFEAPAWVMKTLVGLLAVGFVPALVFSWVFELTPGGLKRDAEVTPEESIAPQTARRMDRTIIVVLLLALMYFTFDRLVLAPRREAAAVATATQAARPETAEPDVGSKSIAVLPFENRSAGGEDAAFFADGIQEDLINTLSRVPGLTVIARTAVLRFRGGTVPMAQVAADLRVTHLVEAGVQRAGDRVRVNVQLLRAGDGQTEWSERYDRTLSATNIFDLQEEIAQAVAATLKLQLSAKAGEKLVTGTTGNLAAYEAFLKGRKQYEDHHFPEAERLLQEAVQLDPDYALAKGALAEAYVSMANSGLMAPKQAFPLAQASARRALELDDHVVQAYTALAEYDFHYAWNWEQAEKSMLRALAIDPNYAIAYARHAGHLTAWGRFDEALAAEERGEALSPPRESYGGIGVLMAQKRFQDVLDRTADQDASEDSAIVALRGTALFLSGRHAEGLARLERAAKLNPDSLGHQADLGWALAQDGQSAKAREILQQLQAASKRRYVSPMRAAQVAAGLNDRELAFAQLEQAFELRDPTLPDIGFDLYYDPIRADPRFRELLKKLKLDVFFPEASTS